MHGRLSVCVSVCVCVQCTNGFYMRAHTMSRTCLMLVTSRFSGRSSRALTLLSALCEAENASHPFEKYFQDDGAYSIQYYYLLVRWKLIRTNVTNRQTYCEKNKQLNKRISIKTHKQVNKYTNILQSTHTYITQIYTILHTYWQNTKWVGRRTKHVCRLSLWQWSDASQTCWTPV